MDRGQRVTVYLLLCVEWLTWPTAIYCCVWNGWHDQQQSTAVCGKADMTNSNLPLWNGWKEGQTAIYCCVWNGWHGQQQPTAVCGIAVRRDQQKSTAVCRMADITNSNLLLCVEWLKKGTNSNLLLCVEWLTWQTAIYCCVEWLLGVKSWAQNRQQSSTVHVWMAAQSVNLDVKERAL